MKFDEEKLLKQNQVFIQKSLGLEAVLIVDASDEPDNPKARLAVPAQPSCEFGNK